MANIRLSDKEFTLLYSAKTIETAIDKIAVRINKDLKGKMPVFIVVLSGAFVFASDLLKKITIDCEVCFVKLSSYVGTRSSGQIKELIGLDVDITDRAVVVIEDIVDTGNTIEQLINSLQMLGAGKIKVASMLFKPDVYSKSFVIDYVGILTGKEFVVGYGLDYNGIGRNLPQIYKLVNK